MNIIELAKQAGMEQDGDMWFSNLYKTDMDVHISQLEAFAKFAYQNGYYDGKKAEQPAQEPVAWLKRDGGIADWGSVECGDTPLYTTPPQCPWVELEGEKIRYLWEEATKPDRSTMAMVTSFAQAIDAALRSKNT